MSAAPELPGVRRVARLSRRALNQALAQRDWRGADAPAIDLRADAYGHGAAAIEAAARAHGASRFTRDGDAPPAEAPSRVIYGFDGGHEPLMTLEGEVIAVKRVPASTPVSYGYTYVTAHESTLALIALGYADGVPRSASNRASVRIGNARGVIAGRIAMDQLVVDLAHSTAAVGDPAVLWNDSGSLAAWCTATGRTADQLTARLGSRVARIWSDE
ncbi:MAG: alanine racemase [Microcella sp.]|uniref:alanine racemase n=1 Tax=Microcella sp. TaxID=1913979 RepID=UPI0024C5AD80|nr:alanine racemase C-terminal domain-containing protein [Microcella sp.]UYN84148.1 MAG: alanine racemase [Microcella sp.]